MNVLETVRGELRAALAERDAQSTDMDAILARAEGRGDGNLTSHESASFNGRRDRIRTLDEQIEALRSRETDLTDLSDRRDAQDRMARRIQPEPTPAGQRSIRVGSEPTTYHEHGEHSFFGDLIRSEKGDYQARDRIERHRREMSAAESRSTLTSGLGGLVPPAYLPVQYAEFLRAMRPAANVCSREPLPPQGMTVNVPRVTTGTVVLNQTTQATAVAEQDMAVTDLSVPVNTYAGHVKVSRQSLDRGQLTDRVIYADLAGAYATKLNADVIAGPGSNGRHWGILSTTGILTVTASSSAFTTVFRTVVNGIQQVNSTRYAAPTVIVMHPRRWGYFASQTDTDGRPLLDIEGTGANVVGGGNVAGYDVVGTLAGVPVLTDGSIPTTESTTTTAGSTEDRIIITRASDLLLWEDGGGAPMVVRFDEPYASNWASVIVAAGYSAFTAGWHPEATRVVVGAGLTTPTFS